MSKENKTYKISWLGLHFIPCYKNSKINSWGAIFWQDPNKLSKI